jgi:hypothetical protein
MYGDSVRIGWGSGAVTAREVLPLMHGPVEGMSVTELHKNSVRIHTGN